MKSQTSVSLALSPSGLYEFSFSSSAFWLSSRLYAGQKATACKLASVMQNQVTDNFLNSSFWSLHLLAFWFIFVSRPEGYSLYIGSTVVDEC